MQGRILRGVRLLYAGGTVAEAGRDPDAPGAGEPTRLPVLLPPGLRMLDEAGLEVGRDVGGVGRTNSSRAWTASCCAELVAPASCSATASCSPPPSCATASGLAAR